MINRYLFLFRKIFDQLAIILLMIASICFAQAQSVPQVPFDLDFAGVTIHVNETGRKFIQQEVNRLYSDRTAIQRTIEILRELDPVIEPLLTDNQLPADFRYVSLPFDNAQTLAYWGITRDDGLNLRIDKSVDERLHPIFATEAFANRIQRLHGTYGNYVSALVQYLLNMEQVDGQQTPARKSAAYVFLDAQSPQLIWKIIARKIVVEREESRYRPAKTFLIYTYNNGGGESLHSIGQQLGVSDEQMQAYNSWLLAKQVPTDKEYPVLVRVAMDMLPAFRRAAEGRTKPTVVNQYDIGFPVLTRLTSEPLQNVVPAVYYSINNRLGVQAQPCDNIVMLAFYGNITIKKFLRCNELTEQHVVEPGHIYYLEVKAKRAKIPYHVVQKNQTMREISDIYGVQLKWLLNYNHMTATQRVQSGRIVWLQQKRPSSHPVEYQVEPPLKKAPVEEKITPTFVEPAPAPRQPVATPQPRMSDSNRVGSAPTPSVPNVRNTVDSSRRVDKPTANRGLDDPDERLRLHTVKPGQTYFSIARQYGVTVDQLYSWNKVSARTPLRVGQELIVDLTDAQKQPVVQPKQVTVIPKPATDTVSKDSLVNLYTIEPAKKATYHIVQAGQTVYRVALINKVSVESVVRWNHLQNYVLKVGQKLIIYK